MIFQGLTVKLLIIKSVPVHALSLLNCVVVHDVILATLQALKLVAVVLQLLNWHDDGTVIVGTEYNEFKSGIIASISTLDSISSTTLDSISSTVGILILDIISPIVGGFSEDQLKYVSQLKLFLSFVALVELDASAFMKTFLLVHTPLTGTYHALHACNVALQFTLCEPRLHFHENVVHPHAFIDKSDTDHKAHRFPGRFVTVVPFEEPHWGETDKGWLSLKQRTGKL